jgi:hypothetical protein
MTCGTTAQVCLRLLIVVSTSILLTMLTTGPLNRSQDGHASGRDRILHAGEHTNIVVRNPLNVLPSYSKNYGRDVLQELPLLEFESLFKPSLNHCRY